MYFVYILYILHVLKLKICTYPCLDFHCLSRHMNATICPHLLIARGYPFCLVLHKETHWSPDCSSRIFYRGKELISRGTHGMSTLCQVMTTTWGINKECVTTRKLLWTVNIKLRKWWMNYHIVPILHVKATNKQIAFMSFIQYIFFG